MFLRRFENLKHIGFFILRISSCDYPYKQLFKLYLFDIFEKTSFVNNIILYFLSFTLSKHSLTNIIYIYYYIFKKYTFK